MDWHTCKLKGTTSVCCMNRVAHERSRPLSINWHTLTHAAGTKTQKHVDINGLSFSNLGVGREKCKLCVCFFFFKQSKPIWHVHRRALLPRKLPHHNARNCTQTPFCLQCFPGKACLDENIVFKID